MDDQVFYKHLAMLTKSRDPMTIIKEAQKLAEKRMTAVEEEYGGAPAESTALPYFPDLVHPAVPVEGLSPEEWKARKLSYKVTHESVEAALQKEQATPCRLLRENIEAVLQAHIDITPLQGYDVQKYMAECNRVSEFAFARGRAGDDSVEKCVVLAESGYSLSLKIRPNQKKCLAIVIKRDTEKWGVDAPEGETANDVEYQFDADSITSYSLDPIEKYGADPVGGVFLEANLPQEYHPGDDIKMYSPKDAGSLVSLGGIPKKPPLVAGSRLLIWCPTTAGQK
jgi:hypothetical protein